MAAKKYSAGAIFLQVVPVFANIQRDIEREVEGVEKALGDRLDRAGKAAGQRAGKSMGEELEKSANDAGKKAGDKYAGAFESQVKRSVKSVQREFDALDTSKFGTISDGAIKDLERVRRIMKELNDQDFSVDFDSRDVLRKLQTVKATLEAFEGKHEVHLDFNMKEMVKDLARAEKFIDEVARPREVELKLQTKQAEVRLGAFETRLKKSLDNALRALGQSADRRIGDIARKLETLRDAHIGVEIDSNEALRQAAALEAELEAIFNDAVGVDVKIDSGKAMAELAVLREQIERIDGKRAEVKVDVDNARRGITGLGEDSQRTGGMLSFLNKDAEDTANSFRAFNGVLFTALALGPALIPMLGALAGGLLAVGPAAAVAAAGLASVLIGFSGIGEAVTALNAQQDQAAMNAGRVAKQETAGINQVANARRSAARAVESALERQKNAQERYKDSVDNVRKAEKDLQDAREKAQNKGRDLGLDIRANQLDIDQALVDSFNATVKFNAVMADGSSTNLDKEEARIARDQALLQLDELRAKGADLAKEKEKWDREGVNGVDSVQNAQDRLNDAIDAQKKAYEDLGKAAKEVDRARADGARQVAQAMKQGAQAAQALTAQQNNVNNAFGKLGKEGQDFANFIVGLQQKFYDFRKDVQAVLLPAVQEAIEGFIGSKSGAAAKTAIIALAESFGKFVQALSQSFQGPAWTAFFEMLATYGPQIQEAFGNAFISVLEAFASILTTLAPYSLQFAQAIEKIAKSFADWAASDAGQEAIQKFMDAMSKLGPPVIDAIVALAIAFADLLVALAPLGVTVLEGITNFLNWLSDLDPNTLAAIATSIVAIGLATQAAFAISSVVASISALLTPVGLVVFALVGLGIAFVALYKKNEDFRKFVKKAWGEISEAVEKAWKDKLKPALDNLWAAFKDLWDEVLQPFFEWLGPILLKFIEFWIPTLASWWSFLANAIAWGIEHLVIPAFKAIKWWWGVVWKYAEPAIKDFKKAFETAFNGIDWLWKNVLKPVFDFIKDKALPRLQSAFETVLGAIGTAWNGLKKLVTAPVKFIIETVLNDGLIKGFNWIADKVGSDLKIKPIPLPEAMQDKGGGKDAAKNFATGGILPGYTPGRDVHSFYSRSAGRLNLSGGEAIMRPEWTQAMGPDYIRQMNKIAAGQGIAGVRKAMQFAKGGIFWPVPGHQTGTYPGHDGVDINRGSGSDDLNDPIWSVADGKVTYTGWDKGYGRSIWINHPQLGKTSLYGHTNASYVSAGQQVSAGQLIGRVGSTSLTGNSSAPHLHFGIYPGGTYGAAIGFLNGAQSIQGDLKAAGNPLAGFGKKAMGIFKDPLGYVKQLVAKPLQKFRDRFGGGEMLGVMADVPTALIKGVVAKVKSIIPDAAKGLGTKIADGAKNVGKAVKNVAGGGKGGEGPLAPGAPGVGGEGGGPSLGFANGGILPYNGTMMYDNGGYLPPGITNVVNLTGKPEPVFTNDQWSGMRGGDGGNVWHYEPHFEGSNLTSGDVAADLNHEFRRARHEGKYQGVGR